MSQFWPFALLILVLAALLALGPARARANEPAVQPAAPAAMPGVANPEFMGMVIRDPYYDYNSMPGMSGPNTVAQEEMARTLARMGVRWVRMEFIADNGVVDFNRFDYFIGTLAPRYNLKVLGLLNTNLAAGSPYLLNTDPVGSDPVYGGGTNDYMRRWLDSALAVAARYNGSNPAHGRVHAFEILNEVNRLGDGTSLPPGVSYAGMAPDRVARMQAKFYRICKNTDNSQPVARCPADTAIIVGGLHPKGTSTRRDDPKQPETFTFTDEAYLAEMYRTAFTDFKDKSPNVEPWKGRWPVDGIGFHPYPEEIFPRLSLQDVASDINTKIGPRLNEVRAALVRAGDPNQPFWITEIGYNVGFYKVRGPLAPTYQALFMREVYLTLAARGDVANVFWFKYEDFPPAQPRPGVDPQQWGVVHIPFVEGGSVNGVPCAGGACYQPSGVPSYARPAFFTYRELAGLPVERVFLPSAVK
ncbi:MAG: hypothetical protein OHK0022_37120 [Roseiflexaceae bacterium]